MKPLITALGVCALLLLPAATYAQVESFTWTGNNGTSTWAEAGNWSGVVPPEYPGQDDTDDAATVDTDGANDVLPEYSSGTRTIGTLTIDSDTNAETVSCDITGGSLTVGTSTTIIGDITHALTDYHASLTVSGGTFDPAGFYLYGGDPGATYHGQARFKLDENGTLTTPDNITVQGDSKFETEQSVTLSGVTLTVQPDNTDDYKTEAVVRVVDAGETMSVGTLTIGGANYSSKLTFTGSGSFATN